MIYISKVEVMGIAGALRGCRNPKNSWNRSDSGWSFEEGVDFPEYFIGDNDINLAKKLCSAGSEHRKFVRMIHVQVDVKAPLLWWKQADQYRIATTTNSTSTMHRIAAKKFEIDDFSWETLSDEGYIELSRMVQALNKARDKYLGMKELKHWNDMIYLLPESYNQLRTWDLNYETLMTIFRQRKHHKLGEWHLFCDWILTLPHMKDFLDAEGELENYKPYEKKTEER